MTDATIDFEGRRNGALVTGSVIAPMIAALVHAVSRAWTDGGRVRRSTRRAGEAAAVRALASRYHSSDRGFAADLYAAADRHEEAQRAVRPGSAADRR
ncbi:MAG: hypothetical protein ABIV63_12825 [Caldimonas sp.]